MSGRTRLSDVERQRNFREARAREGKTLIQVWVEEDLVVKLDAAAKAQKLRSRSEIVSLAVHRLVDTTN